MSGKAMLGGLIIIAIALLAVGVSAQAVLVMASAVGLAILGARIIAIGAAEGFGQKCGAIWRCLLDWAISIMLAVVGGAMGGLEVGGPAGLVAGMVISLGYIGWGKVTNQG